MTYRLGPPLEYIEDVWAIFLASVDVVPAPDVRALNQLFIDPEGQFQLRAIEMAHAHKRGCRRTYGSCAADPLHGVKAWSTRDWDVAWQQPAVSAYWHQPTESLHVTLLVVQPRLEVIRTGDVRVGLLDLPRLRQLAALTAAHVAGVQVINAAPRAAAGTR